MSIRPASWCVAVLVAASGCHREASPPAEVAPLNRDTPKIEVAVPAPTEMDPDLGKLLEFKGGANATAEFADVLERLSKKRDWHEKLIQCKKLAYFDFAVARTRKVQAGQANYVVILLRSYEPIIPGRDLQTAILLDLHGKYLDQIACEISNRLTDMHGGKFHTVIPEGAEPDGAQMVMRLDGESARGNFRHFIYHDGQTTNFYWGHFDLPAQQPTKWDAKGLCRIAIHDAKFAILFPGEKDQTER